MDKVSSLNSRQVKDLNVKVKTIKLWEDHVRYSCLKKYILNKIFKLSLLK